MRNVDQQCDGSSRTSAAALRGPGSLECRGAAQLNAKADRRVGPTRVMDGDALPRVQSGWSCFLTITAALGVALNAFANPLGMTVVSGRASATANGTQLTIHTSQNAFLNWKSFNIAAGETTTFQQPSASSVVWNRINDSNPSQIWGQLNANGMVVLMNQSGFYFGPNSMVKAAGFVATTAVPPPEFVPGGQWEFNGPPPSASIINYGQINVQSGGSIFLIADAIENHGTISAPDGVVGLYAGKQVLVSDRPDGLGISVAVTLPAGSVDNDGRVEADGGSILLNAKTINQNGLIQANSVQQQNGVIELVAGGAVNLGANSSLQANGDDSAVSSGGQITVKSGGSFSDAAGSCISVAGSALGGNGGSVEISALDMPAIYSTVDGHAAPGSAGGRLLLDPTDIILDTSGTGSAGSGSVTAGNSSGALDLNVNSAFIGLSQIDLQATHTITLASGTTWNLAQSTGEPGPGCQLTLEAGTDSGSGIIFNTGSSILGGSGWSVTLEAGRDFTSANPVAVIPGVGNITFNGTSSLQTQDGSITLLAGNNVTVGGGSVTTMGGGGIDVTAVAGSVNTGTKNNGFKFGSFGTGYTVDPNLGGISTGAGGDVNITAGQDITSYLPASGGTVTDAGTGAFGPEAGNVTLTAGHDVVGHYVVCNGTGTINAGNDAGDAARMLALSLASGGWSVNAIQDILLQEVRNPNGTFNELGFSTSATKHYFDYAPNDYVDLTAGDSVELLGGSLPRNSGTFEQNIPSIYPSTLDITAGAGGVTLANDIILFPSPLGQLDITTTAGGSLTGTKPADLTQIIMSDSAASQYTAAASFGADDHAATPIHLDDPQPVSLNIAGDMTDIMLVSPKEANITIGGDMVNSRFAIQNLHPTDISTLNVAGDIVNRNEFTAVPLSTKPNFSIFQNLFPGGTVDINGQPIGRTLNLFYLQSNGTLAPVDPGIAGQFFYDSTAQTLTFEGRMSSTVLQELSTLQVEVLNPNGQLELNPNGSVITRSMQFASSAALAQLFSDSQDVPTDPNTGYVVSGPGTLNVNANNMDLGATIGIQSVGPADNHALATLGTSGATINVNLTGNLDMFSTTISTLAGGAITVNALGDITVGSTSFVGNDLLPRGIFTAAKANVTIIAGGDINVNGSRIGAYDGGNVTVESLHGDVNAGSGGQGFATVEEVAFNPKTGQVQIYAPEIPGSGILATTFPPPLTGNFPSSHNTVGNILVETPEGSIIANAGGIIQLPLNGANSSSATVTLRAGSKDATGNVAFVGDINASGSGVIGANVILDATGNITGAIVAQNNLNLTAVQNVDVTAVAIGTATTSAGGTTKGTIVGVSGVSVEGAGTITASLLSQNVSASGNVQGQVGFAAANVAGATSQSASQSGSDQTKTLASDDSDELDKKNKPGSGKGPVLEHHVGRVTVLLPKG